jgi:hypothetical protein
MAEAIKQPPPGESCMSCKFMLTLESGMSRCQCHVPPWPAVLPTDWCGEWEAIPVVQEAKREEPNG